MQDTYLEIWKSPNKIRNLSPLYISELSGHKCLILLGDFQILRYVFCINISKIANFLYDYYLRNF